MSAPSSSKKRLFVVLGSLAVVALAVALVTPRVALDRGKPAAMKALRERFGEGVTAGSFDYALGRGLVVKDVSVANPPGFSDGPCIVIDEVRSSAGALDLLGSGDPSAGEVVIRNARVNLEWNEQGGTNLEALARAGSAGDAPTEADRKILVENLTVQVKAPGGQTATLPPFRADVGGNGVTKPLVYALRTEGATLDVKGNIQFAHGERFDPTRGKGDLDYVVTAAFLEPLKPVLQGWLGVRATLSGKGALKFDTGARVSGAGNLALLVDEWQVNVDGKPQPAQPGPVTMTYECKENADEKSSAVMIALDGPGMKSRLQGTSRQEAGGPAFDGEWTFDGDVGVVAQRFPMILHRTLQGRLAAKVVGLKLGPELVAGDLEIKAERIHAPSTDMRPIDGTLAKASVVAALREGKLSVKDLLVKMDDALDIKGHLQLDGWGTEPAARLEGELVSQADFAALALRGKQLSGLFPSGMRLKGLAKGDATAKYDNGISTYSIKHDVTGFDVAGINRLAGLEVLTTASLSSDGRLDSAGDWTLTVESLKASTNLASFTSEGRIEHIKTTPMAPMTATFEALPGPLLTALSRRAGLSATGQPITLRVQHKGPLTGGQAEIVARAGAVDIRGLSSQLPHLRIRDDELRFTIECRENWWKRVEVVSGTGSVAGAQVLTARGFVDATPAKNDLTLTGVYRPLAAVSVEPAPPPAASEPSDGGVPSAAPDASVPDAGSPPDADVLPVEKPRPEVPFTVELKNERIALEVRQTLEDGEAAYRGELGSRDGKPLVAIRVANAPLGTEWVYVLKHLSPALYVPDGLLDGRGAFTVEGVWSGAFPWFDDGAWDLAAKSVKGNGTVEISRLKIVGSPLLGTVTEQLKTGGSVELGSIEKTDFRIADGAVSYENMRTHVGGLTLIFSGEIHHDETMALQMVTPFPEDLRKSNAALASYLPENLAIAVSGTLRSPRIDVTKAVQASLKGATEKATKEKAGALMKGVPGNLGGKVKLKSPF